MEKLNKVIAGLECCLSEDKSCEEHCPYFMGEYKLDGCIDDVMADALEVLKARGGDLISRSAFLESIEGMDWYTIHYDGTVSQGAPSEEVAWYKATDVYSAINEAPAVETEPVVHAHWEKFKNPSGTHGIRCSRCKVVNGRKSSFCPECGAKMDEEVTDG